MFFPLAAAPRLAAFLCLAAFLLMAAVSLSRSAYAYITSRRRRAGPRLLRKDQAQFRVLENTCAYIVCVDDKIT